MYSKFASGTRDVIPVVKNDGGRVTSLFLGAGGGGRCVNVFANGGGMNASSG